jgi:HSP20 family protein
MIEMIAPRSGRPLATEVIPTGWIRSKIDGLLDELTHPGQGVIDLGWRSTGPVPALELVDLGKTYSLTAEIPGLSDKDITVELSEGVITIAGEKLAEPGNKDCARLLTERRYGNFRRELALPVDADPDGITAKVTHGLLTVTIDKDTKVHPSICRIEIRS